MHALLLLPLACEPPAAGKDTPAKLELPADAAVGDEIVLTVTLEGAGEWAYEDSPGTLLEAQLGANRLRHVVVPGGVGPVTQRVALGAWEGGAIALTTLTGDAAAVEAAVARGDMTLTVDPDAAGTPLLGSYDDRWWNDTPLVTYEEAGLWTWVFTDEDGGTGLLPTLLMASWGRPVDIEGLWDAPSGTIQTTDHAWVAFDGEWEGTHPLFQVVTANGLIGPMADAPFTFASMPLEFAPEGGPREGVLDRAPWVLAASWAEAEREGQVVPDGGQGDYRLGAPDDYVFFDFAVEGARVSFEVEVDGTWWSSLAEFGTEGLTDARVGGTGRTCVELPPGAASADIAGVRVRAHEGEGRVDARWFAYDAQFASRTLGEALGIAVAEGETADLR